MRHLICAKYFRVCDGDTPLPACLPVEFHLDADAIAAPFPTVDGSYVRQQLSEHFYADVINQGYYNDDAPCYQFTSLPGAPSTWAVLVGVTPAAIEGKDLAFYSVQADVCAVKQQLLHNGWPSSHIITISFDDALQKTELYHCSTGATADQAGAQQKLQPTGNACE